MKPILLLARCCWRKWLTFVRFTYGVSIAKYDFVRFRKYSGFVRPECDREKSLARIIMGYHMIEKGLTMPRRRLDFGHGAICEQMSNIIDFERLYGSDDFQLRHAVGVVKEYFELHRNANFDFKKDEGFWREVELFCEKHSGVSATCQMNFTRDEFYASVEQSFPEFSASRHTCRHFCGKISEDLVRSAVLLAMNAPSACNRQHARIHCVCDHKLRDAIYGLQGGNRGFGTDADKLLIVTGDLRETRWVEERNDVYTNVGIFLMNLCYALHYYKVAHCILNWSVPPKSDVELRRIVKIPNNEVVVALLACGNAPDTFAVASSPRNMIDKILTMHGESLSV